MRATIARPAPQSVPGLTIPIVLGRVLLTLALAFFLVLAALGLAYAAFQGAYHDRIYPGVSSWGVDLSGMSLAQAALALSGAFTYPQAEVFTFRDGERSWTAAPAELGVNLDLPATVAEAYTLGRRGSLTGNLTEQYQAWSAGRSVPVRVVYNPARARSFLEALAKEIDRPLIEASLTADGSNVTVQVGQVGRRMDVEATLPLLAEPINALAGSDLALTVHEFTPEILDPTAQAEAARRILAEPLTLIDPETAEAGPGLWVFDQQTLADLLVIQRVADQEGARYEVGLDSVRLGSFLSELAPDLEREPVNARFIFNDDTRQLDLMTPAVIGRRLDVGATVQAVNERARDGEHTLPLVFEQVLPAVGSEATGEDLGITELVSDRRTTFAGSTSARIQNIKAASKNFHGLLVAPGETFSMVAYMDDVSLDNGYAEALIIFGGRTIKGVGGGVCQVSTTLFRAAFFGGFPIEERYAHAYRVSYYEHGFGPGLDATVYAPLVDFKFTNDTPYWLLIESYVYQSELQFKFYSTSDGRTVEVSSPQVSNVVPAPEPKYEENPDLAPGEIKQVDYAANGADVVVYRTVRRNGEVLSDDVIRTRYLPWQAVYQYGPGTALPTPTPPPG